MAEQPSPSETPPPPKSKVTRGPYFTKLIGILILIVLLAAVILLGLVSKSVWRGLKQQQHDLASTQGNQAAILQRVAELQPQLHHQQQALSDLAVKIKQLNMPFSQQQTWQQLQQIEFQLRLAQEYLTVGVVNLPLALQLVTSAKQQLLMNKQPVNVHSPFGGRSGWGSEAKVPSPFGGRSGWGSEAKVPSPFGGRSGWGSEAKDDMQTSLTTLQQQLLQLRSTNLDYLFAQLTNLMLLAEQLAIAPQTSPTKHTAATTTASATKPTSTATHWYQRQWDALRAYLGQAIVVRHQQHSIMPLSLSQRQLHSTEIHMALLQAEWAILQQNQPFYIHSLQHAEQLLQTYFNSHTQEGAKMLQILQPLTQVELNPNMPSFAPVFQALEAAYKQLQISLPSSHIDHIHIPQTRSTAPKDAIPPPSPLKIPSKKEPLHTLNPAVEI